MPTALLDPRPRTRRVLVDLSNPDRYTIEILRETVQESDTGEVLKRELVRRIVRSVTFDAHDLPVGDARLIALLSPIKAAIEAFEAEDIAAEQARKEALARELAEG